MKSCFSKLFLILPLFALFSCQEAPVSSSSTCQHTYVSKVVKQPTLLEPGANENTCEKCGHQELETTYYFDELVFNNEVYQYDGQPHSLLIKGLLPLGTRVEYKNNSLTEIGEKEASALIYDDDDKLLMEKNAVITVSEHIGLPNIEIDTKGVEILSKDEYVSMSLSVNNCGAEYVKSGVKGKIKIRGNGTATYPKKAYRIKFDSKTNLLGLNNQNKMKSWVLIADYADSSMFRNMTAYYMGNSLFNYSNNYCTDYQHVNVYLNGSYNGVYLLAEQQQANSSRVRINEPTEGVDHCNIGYLLELDAYAYLEENTFSVSDDDYLVYQDEEEVHIPLRRYTIKSDVFTDEQIDFIRKYTSNALHALLSMANGEGNYVLDENHDIIPSPYESQLESIGSFIDVDSLIKMYVLHEFMKSKDVGFSSFYMFVDFSKASTYSHLTFGAPWDFDWSSGNIGIDGYKSPLGAWNESVFNEMNPWLYLISKTDFFADLIAKYYSVFARSDIYEGCISQIDYEVNAFSADFTMNYVKWPTIGTFVPSHTPAEALEFKTHLDAVNYFKNWLVERKAFLDDKYLKQTEV